MPSPVDALTGRARGLGRRTVAGIVAVLAGVPFLLSLHPAVPSHGYGHVLWAAAVLAWLRHPAERVRYLWYGGAILLQALAFPDPDLGWLGWVLLLPYLVAREREDGAAWWRAAFLFGFFRAFAGYGWLGHVHYTAWLAVAFLSGFSFATFFEGFLRLFRTVPYALRVAAGWLLFEWVHSWIGGGLPWLYLGHTQYRFLALVQVADLVGAAGISFLLAFAQAAALDAVRARGPRPELAVAGVLVAGTLAYGFTRSFPGAGPEAPAVLMVQSAFPHSVKEDPAAAGLSWFEIWDRLRELTAEGLAAHPDTDLVVWPETMHPYFYFEDDPARSEDFIASVRVVAWETGLPVVYGANTFTSAARILRGHNSAVLAARIDRQHPPDPGDDLVRGIYRKQSLVPMGEEFLPRRFFPEAWCDRWFAWLRRNLGYPETCDLEAGDGFVVLDAGPGLRCAPLICFEGLWPGLARGALASGEADLLLHLVNNGWFGRSWEQRQCVASWVFRAIETRTPFLSCANAGITCAIAPDGAVLGRVDKVLEEGFLHVRVPPRAPLPLFSRGGRWILPGALVAAFGACLLFRRRKTA